MVVFVVGGKHWKHGLCTVPLAISIPPAGEVSRQRRTGALAGRSGVRRRCLSHTSAMDKSRGFCHPASVSSVPWLFCQMICASGSEPSLSEPGAHTLNLAAPWVQFRVQSSLNAQPENMPFLLCHEQFDLKLLACYCFLLENRGIQKASSKMSQ